MPKQINATRLPLCATLIGVLLTVIFLPIGFICAYTVIPFANAVTEAMYTAKCLLGATS